MAQRIISDTEIAALLAERKPLPSNWQSRLKPRPKADMKFTHRECTVTGDNGNHFRIILRQNLLNVLDFSIILTWVDADGWEYRLIRFNGKHPSQHTNKWEHYRNAMGTNRFRNTFHVHQATERYQLDGYEIDGFAVVTTEYGSFDTALDLFVRRNGIAIEPENPNQLSMFS